MNRVFCLLMFAYILTSCGLLKTNVSGTPTASNGMLLPVDPSYKPASSPYRSADDKIFDLIHTSLNVSFDWERQYLLGLAELRLTPYYFPQSKLVLDAKGFDINEVHLVKDDKFVNLSYEYDSLLLVIDLDREYNAGEEVVLSIDYIAKPNELNQEGGTAIISKKGLYFINPLGKDQYKPRQIWTQGETESSSCWFPTIDSPNQKTTQEMYITVDTSYVSLSNGELTISIENGDGTRTDHWVQSKPHAPYLFMMAVGEFDVHREYHDDLELSYYMEPMYADNAEMIFGNTPEMIRFFSDTLNYPFPWVKYSQIVVRDYVSGAMENTSASLFIELLNQTPREKLDKNWDYIIAHELFHQWFGDLVTCESWSNLALNESFANYSEYLWGQYKYGQDQADYLGWKEVEDYLYQARSKRVPIIRYHYDDRQDMFDTHSYNKGGRVLHMLRTILGDKAFFESLSFYLKEHEYTDVEIHELRLAFEEVTGLDLHEFFDQWFLSPGHPELKVMHDVYGDSLHVFVEQIQDSVYSPTFTFPVQISYWDGGEKVIKGIHVDSREEEFVFHVDSTVQTVVFDEQHYLLAEIEHRKNLEEYRFQLSKEDNYLTKREALAGIEESLKVIDSLGDDKGIQQLVLANIYDDFWAIRNQAVVTSSFLPFDTLLESTLKEVAVKDRNSKVRLSALKVLNDVDSDYSFKDLYFVALKDSSYKVSAYALSTIIDQDSVVVDSLIDVFSAQRNGEYANVIARYFVQEGDTSKIAWLWDNLEYYNFRHKLRAGARLGELSMSFLDQDNERAVIDRLKEICIGDDFDYAKKAAFIGLCFARNDDYVKNIRDLIVDLEVNPKLKKSYQTYLGWYVSE